MGNDTTKADGYTCSICGKHVDHGVGNNAQPVNDGRCCDDCNANVVVPRRLHDVRVESAARKRADGDGSSKAAHEEWENSRKVRFAKVEKKAEEFSKKWADRLSKVVESGRDITIERKMDPDELERKLSIAYPYYDEVQRLDVTETVRMFLAGDLKDDFKEFFKKEFEDENPKFSPEDASFGGILDMLFNHYDKMFEDGLTLAEAGMPEDVWTQVLEFNDSFLFVNLLRVLNSDICNEDSFKWYAAAALHEGMDDNVDMVFTILGERSPRMMLRNILSDLVSSL